MKFVHSFLFVNASMICKGVKVGGYRSWCSDVSLGSILSASVFVGATALLKINEGGKIVTCGSCYTSYAAVNLWELLKRVLQRDGKSGADCEMKVGKRADSSGAIKRSRCSNVDVWRHLDLHLIAAVTSSSRYGCSVAAVVSSSKRMPPMLF